MRTAIGLALILVSHPALADMAIERTDRGSSGVDGVAAAPGCPGLIATWSDTALFVSRDDGASFKEVLTEKPGPVRAVVVNGVRCDVWVARGAHLGLLRKDGTTRWQATPTSATTHSLAVSAAGLLWLGTTDDRTLTLVHLDGNGRVLRTMPEPPYGNAGYDMHLDDDGTVWWMSASEAACGGGGQSRYVSRVDGREWKDVPWGLDTPGAFHPSARGWTYAVGGCGDDARGLCAIDHKGHARRALAIDDSQYTLLVASNGARTVAVAGNQLVSLDGGRATPLATVSGDPRGVALDGRGRALVVAGGALHRLDGRRLTKITASSR